MSDWRYIESMSFWELRVSTALVTIESRPHYCDRGHFVGKVFGIDDIDCADAFPRYYMDLERAKLELAEWLKWRLQSEAARR